MHLAGTHKRIITQTGGNIGSFSGKPLYRPSLRPMDQKKSSGDKSGMGGGFANTELRSLTDPRVFEFIDFITLDDGEAPLECLVEYIRAKEQRRN